jgi:hypothetical protein
MTCEPGLILGRVIIMTVKLPKTSSACQGDVYFEVWPLLRHYTATDSARLKCDNSVWWLATKQRTGVQFRARAGALLGPTYILNQWVPCTPLPGVKRSDCEPHHSPPSISEVKNSWSFSFTPPILLHRLLLIHWDSAISSSKYFFKQGDKNALLRELYKHATKPQSTIVIIISTYIL